jgi:SAM-dependent methyltransferase
MRLESLPLYWRLKKHGEPNLAPDYYPFEYEFDPSLQLVRQRFDGQLLDILTEIYRAESNIGYLQDVNVIAKPYAADFVSYIESCLSTHGNFVRDIMEIGCGGCSILERLHREGYNVIGIDPSPIAIRDGERKNIRVVADFFPTPKFMENVDLIFHSDVLEHVSDPVAFLRDQARQLKRDGLLIVAVPDCSSGIRDGELSMAMHQHLNYFDRESLQIVVEAAGFTVLDIRRAGYGGSLYCCATSRSAQESSQRTGCEKFEVFQSKLVRNARRIGEIISQALSKGDSTVGFYAPLRALPYLSFLGKYSGFRFFDDTNHWYGCFFDGVDVPIENFEDLCLKPVSDLFIMSTTFGEIIKKKVTDQVPEIQRVITLSEMLAESFDSPVEGSAAPHGDSFDFTL